AGHGLAPVFPVAKSASLLASHLLAVSDQPRAAGAGDDFAVKDCKPGHSPITSHGLACRRDVAGYVSAGSAANPKCLGDTGRDVASNVSTNSGSGPTANDEQLTTGCLRLTLLSLCLYTQD